MPTWKRKDELGKVHFQFLCESCSRKKQVLLETDQWTLVRGGDPVSCNDCVLQCALTVRELWGAEDQLRYRVCDQCSNYETCALKGRYYC